MLARGSICRTTWIRKHTSYQAKFELSRGPYLLLVRATKQRQRQECPQTRTHTHIYIYIHCWNDLTVYQNDWSLLSVSFKTKGNKMNPNLKTVPCAHHFIPMRFVQQELLDAGAKMFHSESLGALLCDRGTYAVSQNRAVTSLAA